MTFDPALTAETAPAAGVTPVSDGPATSEENLVEDVLVEEVSIDGMCGVY